MNLGFSTKINGVETLFVDKILEGLAAYNLIGEKEYNLYVKLYLDKLYSFSYCLSPKIHTIREDSKDEWKVGMLIHFIINNRTKNKLQFAPIMIVKSIQKVQISNVLNDRYAVEIDGITLNSNQIDILAKNDGFESTNDFWDFFTGEDFTGKIIHWTNYKY